MLGHPALVARHRAGDAQGVALLAEQRVAAVAGAEGPDRALLGELHDVLGVVARPARRPPGPPPAACRPSAARGPSEVAAASSSSILRSTSVPMRAITRMRGGDVRRVGDLHAEHRVLGLEVAHHERDDVHRPALHAARVELAHDGLHLARVHPVVGGPAVLLVDRADVGAVLDARHVGGVGGGVEGVGLLLRVEPGEGAGGDQGVGQLDPLLVGAGAPVDAVRGGELGDLGDEGEDALVGGGARSGSTCRRSWPRLPRRTYAMELSKRVPRPCMRPISPGSTPEERAGAPEVTLRVRRSARRDYWNDPGRPRGDHFYAASPISEAPNWSARVARSSGTGACSSTDRASDYGSEGWGFEYLQARRDR